MTWWMKMPRELPRTMESALEHARSLAQTGDRSAQGLLSSGFHDEAGQLVGRIRNEPWCDRAVSSMNSAPDIFGTVTDFSNKWNSELLNRLYGAKPRLSGEYIDSAEGYVTDEYHFRREYFAAMTTPLTFASDSNRPAVYRGLIAFDYIKAIADALHPHGRFTMANSTPGDLCWLAGQLDVMGTETNWSDNDRWRPMSDTDLMYRRTLCAAKPYCLLMNTQFERFSRKMVEKFMKRSLAYGFSPGFFNHNTADAVYFERPELYNRDRDLFVKYIPLCKLVAQAGWQPVTLARSNDPNVHVERFGRKYLTIFNDLSQARTVRITLDGVDFGSDRDLVSKRQMDWEGRALNMTLGAEDVAVVEVR